MKLFYIFLIEGSVIVGVFLLVNWLFTPGFGRIETQEPPPCNENEESID